MSDLHGQWVFILLTITLMSLAVVSQSDPPDVNDYAPPPGLFGGMDTPTNKTIDQLITDALGGIDVASNKILAPGAYVLAELDMYLSQEQFLRLYDPPSNHVQRGPNGTIERARRDAITSRRHKRKATRNVILRWPGGQIPYQFARGHFSPKERYQLKQSMTEWERYTCLKFRPATAFDDNIVRFQNGEGCNSQLGMVGGVQLLNLDVAGCRFKGLYLHEMGHAIGLVHEHQLPDRDRYIDILLQNVAPHFRIFFNKYSTAVVNQFNVPYEYSSVMHYGTTAFSYNGKAQTIQTKDRKMEDSIGKVYLKELSFSDVKVVSEMYSCNEFCPDVVHCTGEGYLDMNCNCVCPDGTDSCEVRMEQTSLQPGDGSSSDNDHINDSANKDVMINAKADSNCKNNYDGWKCMIWANQGECERNAMYMKKHCAKSCGLCDKVHQQEAKNHFTTWAWQWFGMFTNLFPKNWMIGVCKDVYIYEKCNKWKEQGDCVTNSKWMEKNCKMTCNFCGNPALRSETNCRNHHDDEKCDKWALEGECVLNAKWMRDHCRHSCHSCSATDMPGHEDDSTDEEAETCFDEHDSAECAGWARAGECSNNPTWMIANCRRSCAKCDDGTCKNLYDDTQCQVWAEEMQCLQNSGWMHENCGKACGICDINDSDTEGTPDIQDDDDDDNTADNNDDDDDNVDNGDDDGVDGSDQDGTVDKDTTRTVVTSRPYTTHRPSTTKTTTKTTIKTTKTTRRPQTPDTADCFNSHNDVECNTWAETGHCDINPLWMHSHCTKACAKCVKDEEKGHQDEKCEDRNPGCTGWAEHGFCESNPRYNLIYCKKSCNNCNGCRDEQFLCRLWAKAGHCKTNAGYMLRQCQRSCHACR